MHSLPVFVFSLVPKALTQPIMKIHVQYF